MTAIDHDAFVQLLREQLPAIKSWHADWGRLDVFRFTRFSDDAVKRGDWDTVQRAFAIAQQAFERGDPKLRSSIFGYLSELKLEGANGEHARGLLQAELGRARDASLAWASQTEIAMISVYQLPTQYFLYPLHGGNTEIWRAGPPSLAMPLETSEAKLGEAVSYLLTESRPGVPSPELSREASLALLKPARVRSWTTLQRKAKLVHISATEREIRVAPTRNGGNRGDDKGFHFLGDRAELLERNPAHDALGASVRRAFGFSTPPPEVNTSPETP